MSVCRLCRAVGLLAILGLCAMTASAADWMINEDYKQTDPRGATDFDILLQGNVGGQITGGGQSPVTNPFANPTRTSSTDPFGNTVVRFAGSNTIPADPNADRHVGIYGTGPKPRVLVKAWSFATDPKRVPVPKSNFSFVYDPANRSLTITVENTSPDTVTFSEVGFLIENRERPIDQLTRRFLPPDAFEPAEKLNGEYVPGTSASFEIPGVAPTSFAITYATVRFSGSSAANAYKLTGGEWAQVAVAKQTTHMVAPDADAAPVGTHDGGGAKGAWGLFLLMPLLLGGVFAVRARARRTAWVLLGALACGTASPLAANVYVMKLLPPSPTDESPTISINGVPVVIDPGANSPLYVNPGAAGALGLDTSAGTPGASSGVGGTTPTTTGVPVPAGSANPSGASTPVTPQGQGSANPPMPSTATVGSTGSATPEGLLGSRWLNLFYYGKIDGYFWLVEKDQGAEGVSIANSMAFFLAGKSAGQRKLAGGVVTDASSWISRPPGTQYEAITPSPAKVLPPGTDAMDEGWLLGVDVVNPAAGTTVANASFLIKSGLPMTLISDRLAQQLGLNLATLPRVTTEGNFGPIKVRKATLTLALFANPTFPTFTIPVGVTDKTTNPFGENFLANDILGSLFSWEISAVEGDGITRFFAAP